MDDFGDTIIFGNIQWGQVLLYPKLLLHSYSRRVAHTVGKLDPKKSLWGRKWFRKVGWVSGFFFSWIFRAFEGRNHPMFQRKIFWTKPSNMTFVLLWYPAVNFPGAIIPYSWLYTFRFPRLISHIPKCAGFNGALWILRPAMSLVAPVHGFQSLEALKNLGRGSVAWMLLEEISQGQPPQM